MSEKYPGGLITKTPVTPTGPYQTGAASGVWTRDQQLQYQKQGIWPTAGLTPNYIEDVFSTYLYTGNGSTQTITNGIDVSTKGGLVWTKVRSTSGFSHMLSDTARGAGQALFSDLTLAQANYGSAGIGFTTSGFTVGAGDECNSSGKTLVGWTFRKQPKFFDIVTYTGDGTTSIRNITHNLGSVPQVIFIKRTDTAADWKVTHFSNSAILRLNSTDAANTTANLTGGYPADSSSTNFQTIGHLGDVSAVNASGGTYVAYLFASNAGGFGLTGTDNVITCGSFTTNGSGSATVSLGYEPQWIMIKRTDSAGGWPMFDNMRGWTLTESFQLQANSSAAESSFGGGDIFYPTATGFSINAGLPASATYIYIAIRRGPMKTPTTGTSVFNIINSGGATGTVKTTGIVPDLAISKVQLPSAIDSVFEDRLRAFPTTDTASSGRTLIPSSAAAEQTTSPFFYNWNSTTATIGSNSATGWVDVSYFFQRAPGFFDEVCYTGTGVARTVTHNLGVAPEMVIVKSRSDAYSWPTLVTAIGGNGFLFLDSTTSTNTASSYFNNTYPTSTVFSVGTNAQTNGSGSTFVAYLFASCPGVSKVGSYTGTGASQVINCGFTSGARFVMIKRTDSTGDWYVWDTLRGMVSGTDPYLLLNSTAAEVFVTNYVFTSSTGFTIQAAAPAAINASGGTYIFLAIA